MKKNNLIRLNRWKLIFSIIFFLCLYFVIAYLQDNFSFLNFDYNKWAGFYMAWITEFEFQSFIWKILLIIPSATLLALLLIEKETHFKFYEEKHNELLIILVLLCASIILIISINFVFHETPVTDDEYTYDFQAQTLLAGRIINPPPPVKENFNNVFIINDGRSWVGKYNLGHPIIIAMGMLLGNRYIFTIILSISTLLLIYFITYELFKDKKLAFFSMVFGALSPFFYLISSSRLSHTTSAFFLAFFTYLFLRSLRTENSKFKIFISLLAGFSVGYAFNTRPLTAIGFSLPFIILLTKKLFSDFKNTLGITIGMMVGFFIVFFFTLWYNYKISGNPIVFPFNYYSSEEAIGFGTYGHTPFLGLKNLIVEFFRLNITLFGFPISLLFILIQILYTRDSRDYFLFGIILSFSLAYFFYYSPGVADLGPVYYYELLIPIMILTVRGIKTASELALKIGEKGKSFVYTFVLILIFSGWLTFVPEKVTHISRLTAKIREPYELIHSYEIHNAVIFIKRTPLKGWVFGYQNPSPKLNDDIIYCRLADRNSNLKLLKHFEGRSFFILNYNEKSQKSELIWADRTQL